MDATTFREFFSLPGDEWKWHFDIPGFGARFVALDIQHISDLGTTWQTCHAFNAESDQFRWFRERLDETNAAFVFSIMNEKQSALNGATAGAWRHMPTG